MGLGDLYEVTLTQESKGQTIANVFHYHQVLAFIPVFSSNAAVLASNFQAQMLPLISSWQPIDIVTTSIRARNLFVEIDDFTLQLAVVGSAPSASQTLPLFSAIAFALGGENAAVKNGAKRFAGVSEDVQDDGVITNTTFIAQMNNLADKIEGYITVGTAVQDNVFKSVIVKRVREGVKPGYTYRMPANSAEGIFSNIIVVAFRSLISSQVSRKIGL